MDLKLEKFYALGGNHLLKAMSDLLLENPENPNVDCLRHITCDVYQNLTSDEALFVSCWHNRQSQHKDITLQKLFCQGKSWASYKPFYPAKLTVLVYRNQQSRDS
ncbi:hypothetical protein DPMN_161348 [Dreissena polymorpha]|uniref:Uncharacterized protein n=1 Tax=Dreissena polymorpha TaxID=45954 RepID=A0A9D4IPL0_DREPO|nr:hypothetical protein DPMN_161348 [Dreissena polymorpha]